ncbi:PI-PLC X domain-containing protein 1 [Drosophila tropicalis]|uniref:PI-PLC X domain-containing protein 1 n=1 Tax=Drosophila tropicalis TaxID=46794 RepID=UPI0035ABEF2D
MQLYIFILAILASGHASNELKLWLTISAQKRFLEISWINAPTQEFDHVMLTNKDPFSFEERLMSQGTPLASYNNNEDIGSGDHQGDIIPVHGFTRKPDIESQRRIDQPSRKFWISNGGFNEIVAAVKPTKREQWISTGVPFDYELSRNITAQTICYGYWASYIDQKGTILAKTCLKAFPRWMNDMRSVIGDLRLRDLFIPGSHDSGSYRPNFDPLIRENLVTKYALTQDDDIRGQLLHGVRYLDLRVGYFRAAPEKFFIYHGITKQRPLQEVINQVRDFVHETNEIVIFGLKEFPVGFGKGNGVHRLLVSYLREQFEDLYVHPSATWAASLNDIWSRKQNIIIAYDKSDIIQEFPQLLFSPIDQRWGNVQSWSRLDTYLRQVNELDVGRFSSRPVADMAELTPETWDVILDKHGGLRKMADQVNWRVSILYRDELGKYCNIVAADFIRGTTLIDTAIDVNRRRAALF